MNVVGGGTDEQLGSRAFGRRLREAMDARELRGAELARRANVTHTSLSKWLHGKRFPSNDALARLCGALGTTSDWLLRGEGAAPTQSNLPLPVPAQPISVDPARGSGKGRAIVVEAATRRALRLIAGMDAETLALWLQVGERLARRR